MLQRDVIDYIALVNPNGSFSVNDIAPAFTSKSKSQLSNCLYRLYKRGLLERSVDLTDLGPGRPRYMYFLSELGREMITPS